MHVLRTPDERFVDLADFPFSAHYVEISSGDPDDPRTTLRVHYLDEGPAEAAPLLLMHGEPSWAYLYRHMIPVLVAAGHRCVVPDLVGFGRSDKPSEMSDYSYARHVAWMSEALFDRLDLRNVTLFGQDWGSLIGLRLVAAEPDRFDRVAIGNGGMPDGTRALTDAFMAWQKFSKESPSFTASSIINGGTTTELTAAVLAAYDAPFPDDAHKVASRIIPSLVPTGSDDPAAADNQAAWEVLECFTRPFLLTFSDGDPITSGGDRVFLRRVPGTQGQAHTTVEGAGHFLQEDKGPELAAILNAFIAANPTQAG